MEMSDRGEARSLNMGEGRDATAATYTVRKPKACKPTADGTPSVKTFKTLLL